MSTRGRGLTGGFFCLREQCVLGQIKHRSSSFFACSITWMALSDEGTTFPLIRAGTGLRTTFTTGGGVEGAIGAPPRCFPLGVPHSKGVSILSRAGILVLWPPHRDRPDINVCRMYQHTFITCLYEDRYPHLLVRGLSLVPGAFSTSAIIDAIRGLIY